MASTHMECTELCLWKPCLLCPTCETSELQEFLQDIKQIRTVMEPNVLQFRTSAVSSANIGLFYYYYCCCCCRCCYYCYMGFNYWTGWQVAWGQRTILGTQVSPSSMPRDQIQVTELGSKSVCPLKYLAGLLDQV